MKQPYVDRKLTIGQIERLTTLEIPIELLPNGLARIGVLDATADRVLAHKAKPKSKPARKRARRAKKIAQAADA